MSKKGLEFDSLQIENLRGIVREQVKEKNHACVFYSKAWESWSANLDDNEIYKNTPSCFRDVEVFLFQFAKVLVEEFDCSIDTAIAELYSQYVYMRPSISNMLDVVSTNAKTALKKAMANDCDTNGTESCAAFTSGEDVTIKI